LTLKELAELGVGFVSLTEALDLTTPTGRAMAGLLSVFAAFENEILRERIRAGIAEARLKGKHLGRAVTVGKRAGPIRTSGRSERMNNPPQFWCDLRVRMRHLRIAGCPIFAVSNHHPRFGCSQMADRHLSSERMLIT
jgi:hypothetical protein